MCLKYAEYLFFMIGILLSIMLAFRTYFPDLFKNSNKFSPVMAFLGGLLVFYVLVGLILAVILPNVLYKLIMLVFALSPFIIGKLVSYEKLKFYSTIQVLCVILSVVFVILI